ncbi:hypothetical protein PC116_g26611 [Phytophthora cactorum]|nr:hypothetical protein Pcac1_g5179 [Phytophthora cactorum]KAG2875035.1 hypothetical protein PC114_g24944 [Phytophthora cactorum]KAG4042701.1 hypothetical protein PC123_g21817 [Phytophthora cactorum]KAG4224946.1 hypothetical protein PC116_g26611 [Phytophthora cactorum]
MKRQATTPSTIEPSGDNDKLYERLHIRATSTATTTNMLRPCNQHGDIYNLLFGHLPFVR